MLGSLSKRTGTTVGALLLAAVATVALFGYMRGVEREALAKSDPVTTFVAADAIAPGTSVDDAIAQNLIVETQLPRLAIVEGAVANLDEIRTMVVTDDIVKGEQIVRTRFADDFHETTIEIPDGHQAMSLQVSSPPGVAGYVQPKDHVSILARIGDGERARVQYVVQDVEVLAVGERPAEDGQTGSLGGESTAITLTLAVTPEQSEKLGYATLVGEVYFTLVPPGQGTHVTPGRDASNLFS